jgi:hypothetical protein
LDTSRWAMKKSGFADWKTVTFTAGSLKVTCKCGIKPFAVNDSDAIP